MYREQAARVAGAVLWQQSTPAGEAAARRVLPDGCMDLIWVDGTLLVAGPDTTAFLTVDRSGTTYTGLRFAPGDAPAVLGVPAYELRDRRVPLADLWPARQVRLLTERLAETPRPGRMLESIAAGRVPRPDLADPLAPAVVSGLPSDTVAGVARTIGLSERQLHRRCLVAFGYGPKTLARVLRLQRALLMARAGTPFATVAADAGYADQAHLAREVKALAGVPLGVLTH